MCMDSSLVSQMDGWMDRRAGSVVEWVDGMYVCIYSMDEQINI